jgi:hypothetical protein
VQKLLMLCGSDIQIHAIERAVEMEVLFITCDGSVSSSGVFR